MSRTDHQIDVAIFYLGYLFIIFESILHILTESYPDKDVGPLLNLVEVAKWIFSTGMGKSIIAVNIFLELFVPAE